MMRCHPIFHFDQKLVFLHCHLNHMLLHRDPLHHGFLSNEDIHQIENDLKKLALQILLRDPDQGIFLVVQDKDVYLVGHKQQMMNHQDIFDWKFGMDNDLMMKMKNQNENLSLGNDSKNLMKNWNLELDNDSKNLMKNQNPELDNDSRSLMKNQNLELDNDSRSLMKNQSLELDNDQKNLMKNQNLDLDIGLAYCNQKSQMMVDVDSRQCDLVHLRTMIQKSQRVYMDTYQFDCDYQMLKIQDKDIYSLQYYFCQVVGIYQVVLVLDDYVDMMDDIFYNLQLNYFPVLPQVYISALFYSECLLLLYNEDLFLDLFLFEFQSKQPHLYYLVVDKQVHLDQSVVHIVLPHRLGHHLLIIRIGFK